MKKLLFFIMLVPFCSFKTGSCLHSYAHHSIGVDEPSDICTASADPSHYFIVSNRGCIAETDNNGKVIRHTKYDGSDYEGICMKGNMIYALDESARRIDIMNESDFKVKKSTSVHYSGPRNKGFEGITYVPEEKKFILVVEKPAMVFELNEDLQVTAEMELKQFKELSAVTYHDKFLWFLSDENHEVMKVNPADYSIVDRWKLPVINPEGIAFDANGDLLIVSDDMAMLFKFKMNN